MKSSVCLPFSCNRGYLSEDRLLDRREMQGGESLTFVLIIYQSVYRDIHNRIHQSAELVEEGLNCWRRSPCIPHNQLIITHIHPITEKGLSCSVIKPQLKPRKALVAFQVSLTQNAVSGPLQCNGLFTACFPGVLMCEK